MLPSLFDSGKAGALDASARNVLKFVSGQPFCFGDTQSILFGVRDQSNKPRTASFLSGRCETWLRVIQIEQAATELFGVNSAQHGLIDAKMENCVFMQTDRKEIVIDLDRLEFTRHLAIRRVPMRGNIT